MGDRGHIFNRLDCQASRLKSRYGTLATGARALDPDFDFFDAEFHRFFRRLLCGTLTGKRGTLATSLEVAGTATGPTEAIALRVGNSNRRVIKRRADMRDRRS